MPITIVEERPDSVDAVQLITELDTHLNRQLYPQESRHAFSIDKLVREGVAFFITRYDGEPAGCGEPAGVWQSDGDMVRSAYTLHADDD